MLAPFMHLAHLRTPLRTQLREPWRRQLRTPVCGAGLALLATVIGCTDPRARPEATERQSVAADVPNIDVRRLPESRKASAPDVMLQAADRGRALGSESARVAVHVVADFECADCGAWLQRSLPELQRVYIDSGHVRLRWVHFPLRIHPNAVLAASGAHCASAQGKFFEAAEPLLAARARWQHESDAKRVLDSLAGAPGVEPYALRLCTESRRMWRQIHDDIAWANSAGVGAVPSIVLVPGAGGAVGSRVLPLTTPLALLRSLIDSALVAR